MMARGALAAPAATEITVRVQAPDAGMGSDDPRLVQSREIAARFQKELSGRLMKAMSVGGPVKAIEVCNDDAPLIAAQLSQETGAGVARTALKVRNPANAADARARAVLEEFQRAVQAGSPATERFDAAPDGSARYMKAILTQPMCLACHGADLAPEVTAALAAYYPADQATGFAVGDLRGAFVVEWPSREKAEHEP
jgi:hypothetical protein